MKPCERTPEPGGLVVRASRLVEAAGAAGADHADAVVASGWSLGVDVRHGLVEETRRSEADDFSLRVFAGGRTATVSANHVDDVAELAERAMAMARVSPADPFASLAEPERLCRKIRDLEIFDGREVAAEELTEQAITCEEAALAVKGVTNSGGASASFGMSAMVLVTSGGFEGHYRVSRFGRSVSVIGGEDDRMERDYDFDSKSHYVDLTVAEEIGRSAGQRAVARLNPRRVETQTGTVMFDPRVSGGLLGHFAGAINGAAIARKTSFLRDAMDETVFSPAINVVDDPHRPRGSASRPFDGEGVDGEPLAVVEDGVLRAWLLDTATGNELGLATNGRARRAAGGTSPGATNLAMQPGTVAPDELMRSVGSGFYVTELIGQGVNLVSGDYSRGASGFWIENGEIAYPVSEVTIAGNLKTMFANLVAASDLTYRYAINAPTVAIEGMTIGGA